VSVQPRHLNLGEVIARLEDESPTKRLKTGFRHPHSYRGDYHELAFEFAEDVTVREMLSDARSAIGATFQGWKGGDYTMDAMTYVWLVVEEGTSVGETLGAVLLELMLASTAREEVPE
jgi:hypothetical protein